MEEPREESVIPYVWAGLTFVLLGIIFVLGLLFLRPALDPLILITAVVGAAGTMFTGAAAFIKSRETHDSVNGKLAAWKQEFFTMAHAQGVIAGTDLEQKRVAELKRVAASAVPVVTPAAIVPAAVAAEIAPKAQGKS